MPIELNAASESTVAPIREALRAAEKIRSLRFPDAEASPPSSVLPTLANRQGKLLGFNLTTGAPEAVAMPTSASQLTLGSDATGDVYYRNSSGTTTRLPIGSSGQVLTVTGGIPSWSTPASGAWSANATETLTNKTLSTGTVITAATMTLGSDSTGDIYYRAAGGALTRLAPGTNGQVLTLASGIPSWATPASGAWSASATETLTNKTLSTGTVITAATMTLGSDSTGDIYYRTAGGLLARLPIGSAGQVLTASSGLPLWASPAGGGGGTLTNWVESISTAAPNNTIPVVRLIAENTATDVDVVLSPKGIGALLAHVPDSTATGGNKRGTHSVDWQRSRTAAAQVASGSASTLSGGSGNTASGFYSTVSGGTGNTASGNAATVGGGSSNTASAADSFTVGTLNVASGVASFAGGKQSSTRGIQSAEAFAAGAFSATGDAQRAAYVLSTETTTATPTELTAGYYLADASKRIVLPNNSTYSFTGQVVARTSAGECAAWRISGTIKRGANAASTALVGTPTKSDTNATSGAAAWDITVEANTTDGALRIKGTGAAAVIHWVARIDTVEIVY